MALAATRAPDIINRQSIPLSATSDQPVDDVPRPPVSASNDPADLQTGIPKEITAAELALAEAARKGDPATADLKEADPAKKPDAEAAKTDDEPLKVDQPDPDDAVDPKLPNWAQKQILAEKKKAREYRAAVEAAAKTKMGSPEWEAAIAMARDQVIQKEREAVKTAGKKQYDAEQALVTARAELEAIKAKGGVVEDKPAEDPRPTRDQFDDPDLYDNALTEWGEREGERKIAAKAAAATIEADRVAQEEAAREAHEAQAAEVARVKETWDTKVAEAKTRYDDFEEVVTKKHEDGGPLVTDAMTAAVMMVENGPDVAYHLGINVDESKRIAELPTPARQLIEIGRLAERLANPPRRARPAAPIEPIDGTGNEADTSEREPSMEEYAAKRMPQLQAQRRPFYPPSQIH